MRSGSGRRQAVGGTRLVGDVHQVSHCLVVALCLGRDSVEEQPPQRALGDASTRGSALVGEQALAPD